MYTDLLPSALFDLNSFILLKEHQLNEYSQKPSASKQAISIQTEQLFKLKNAVSIIQNSFVETQNEKVEHGTKKYMQGLNDGQTTDPVKRIFNNTYHAGNFIQQFVNALKPVKL